MQHAHGVIPSHQFGNSFGINFIQLIHNHQTSDEAKASEQLYCCVFVFKIIKQNLYA